MQSLEQVRKTELKKPKVGTKNRIIIKKSRAASHAGKAGFQNYGAMAFGYPPSKT